MTVLHRQVQGCEFAGGQAADPQIRLLDLGVAALLRFRTAE